jgi:hypothetical protein
LQLAAQPPDFFSAHELTARAANSIRLIISKCEARKLFGGTNSIARARIEFISVCNLYLNLLLIYLAAGFSPAAQIHRPKGKRSGVQISPRTVSRPSSVGGNRDIA